MARVLILVVEAVGVLILLAAFLWAGLALYDMLRSDNGMAMKMLMMLLPLQYAFAGVCLILFMEVCKAIFDACEAVVQRCR